MTLLVQFYRFSFVFVFFYSMEHKCNTLKKELNINQESKHTQY